MALTDSDAIDQLSGVWNTFVTESDTTDPEDWDTAWNKFLDDTVELLKNAPSGHPSGYPKRRPN